MARESRLIRDEYFGLSPLLGQFCQALAEQLGQLLSTNKITLAVPLEHRVKSWDSISEKIERLDLKLDDVRELNDAVGVRAIVLFRRDLLKARELISRSFQVIEEEDTAARLTELQFGYQSWHYVVELPATWLAVPSLAEFRGLRAELQLRTVAQHLWAAASHKLQYKAESSVPLPLRRSIHRVSAILELVDLEFDRVLGERDAYVEAEPSSREAEPINVDVLAQVLDAHLPSGNKGDEEQYSELVLDFAGVGIRTTRDLVRLIEKHRDQAIQNDQEVVAERLNAGETHGTSEERLARGVYYLHTGLAREILSLEFGNSWREKTTVKRSRKRPSREPERE